jgi:hypothetical protein
MKTLREYIELVREADYPMGARPGAGQITQQNLTPDEYTAKMNYINQMRQQQGQSALNVTPKGQIATPTDTAPKVVYDQNASGQAAKPATPKPAAPAAKDPKVLALQTKLNALGAGLTADGVMGPKTKAAMEKYGLDINGNSTAKNVAQPGQPPATLAKDTPIAQAQTDAAAMAIKKGQANPDSIYGKTTIAQPTGEIAPTNVNRGSGVGKDFKIDPAQAAAVADNASEYDKAWLAQQSGGAPKAYAGPGQTTPPVQPVQPRPANMRSRAAAEWNQKYGASHDPVTGKPLKESSELVAMLTIAGLR